MNAKRKPVTYLERTPPPRAKAVWEEDVPGVDVPRGGAFEDIIDGLSGMLETGLDARALEFLISDVRKLAERCDRADADADTLIAHAENLQSACVEMEAAAEEAETIRDAIEGYPGTAPGVWADAFRIARDHGNIRDMWVPRR